MKLRTVLRGEPHHYVYSERVVRDRGQLIQERTNSMPYFYVYPEKCLKCLPASLVSAYAALRPRNGFSHPHQEHMKDTYIILPLTDETCSKEARCKCTSMNEVTHCLERGTTSLCIL